MSVLPRVFDVRITFTFVCLIAVAIVSLPTTAHASLSGVAGSALAEHPLSRCQAAPHIHPPASLSTSALNGAEKTHVVCLGGQVPQSTNYSALNVLLGPQASSENHQYVNADQNFLFPWQEPAGISGSFGQYQPLVDPNDKGPTSKSPAAASIAQFVVGNGAIQSTAALEFGWIVAPNAYQKPDGSPDDHPHLFVFTRYRDANDGTLHTCLVFNDQGTWKCLDQNGDKKPTDFVAATNTPPLPQDPVEVTDTPQQYAVEHYQGNWWLWYKDRWMGYLPDTHWHASKAFTSVASATWFGEVVSYHDPPCEDMGNGTRGSQDGSAVITNMFLIMGNGGPYPNADAKISYSRKDLYDAGHFVPDNPDDFHSFTYGGPEACAR